MMSLNKYLKYTVLLLLSLIFLSCSRTEFILHTVDDLNGSKIAILDHSIDEQDFEEIFPESDLIHFKSSSEFLLALSMGKCDAGVADKNEGQYLLNSNYDFVSLSDAKYADPETILILHRRLLPERNYSYHNDNFLDNTIDRIDRSIISDGYWMLILRGFAATISIFLLGITLAFLLAVLMLGMNSHRYLKYVSGPLSWFIRTIHDVPSIVLIFFFYYIVFAYTHVNGIIVCAISLGVYTSGSLMNIFTVHLKQIDRNQHAAAEMLGLRGWNKYRYVILPQAFKPMLPLIGAECKVLLRATTYAGYISEIDLVKVTEIIRNQTYDVLIPLLLVSIIFLILSHLIVEALSAIYNKAFKYD
jgi:ABC-type amino acid transport system permease subunit